MATAGTPLRVSPARARSIRNIGQLGASAAASVSTAEANSAATMTGLRPQTSESGPAIRRETASSPVDRDRARLLSAGLTWNSSVKTGRSGWTQYGTVKVENPAAVRARVMRRNASVPVSMRFTEVDALWPLICTRSVLRRGDTIRDGPSKIPGGEYLLTALDPWAPASD